MFFGSKHGRFFPCLSASHSAKLMQTETHDANEAISCTVVEKGWRRYFCWHLVSGEFYFFRFVISIITFCRFLFLGWTCGSNPMLTNMFCCVHGLVWYKNHKWSTKNQHFFTFFMLTVDHVISWSPAVKTCFSVSGGLVVEAELPDPGLGRASEAAFWFP